MGRAVGGNFVHIVKDALAKVVEGAFLSGEGKGRSRRKNEAKRLRKRRLTSFQKERGRASCRRKRRIFPEKAGGKRRRQGYDGRSGRERKRRFIDNARRHGRHRAGRTERDGSASLPTGKKKRQASQEDRGAVCSRGKEKRGVTFALSLFLRGGKGFTVFY